MCIHKRIKIVRWSLFFLFLFSLAFTNELGLAQVPITASPAAPPDQVNQPDPFKEKISLDYKDADISSIIRSLSYTYGLNLATSGDVKGKITVSLKDVTLAEALDVILTANGYNYTHKGSIIYITPGAVEGAQLVSEPISLEYLKAGDAQNLLRKVLSPKGDIKVDEMFNILVVTDFPANVEKLKELLRSVDKAPQQVLIEAKIVDITSKDLQNLGVTWQVDYNPLHGLWNRSTDYSERLKGTGTFAGQSTSLTGGQIKIDTFVLKGLTATATLDALIQDQKASLLASPSIAVINNREARIIIGEKVPYKERTQTTTGTTETTKFIDVGTTLRVVPSINEDGYITMAIHPEVSSVKALLDAGPQITTREADTMVRVKEGETVVIGGLIKQEDNRVISRMPILGYIPFIGYAFGNRNKDQTQQELTVFITPKIIRSRDEMLAHGKKRYEEEAVVNITTTGSLNAQKEMMDKANNLDAAVGLESRRKDDWMLKNQAVSIYESVLSQFPDGPMAPEAGFRAARVYYNDLNESYRARELCAVVISNYPNSEYTFHARELYKKIVTGLEKERLEKLKKSGRKDYYQERDKEKAIENTLDKAVDKEKADEARAAREEAKRKADQERLQILAQREKERVAKEEAQKKLSEEKKRQQEQLAEARQKALEEKKKQQEELAAARRKSEEERKIKEDEERLAREEARKQELEARNKAAEEARISREESRRKADEERRQILAQREKERVAKEESRQKALEEKKKQQEELAAARRKSEEERIAKEDEVRKAREEEQRIAREKSEAQRKAQDEVKKLARAQLDSERKVKEEVRRRAIEEKNKQQEQARLAREEQKRRSIEERKIKEDETRKAREEERRITREKTEAERLAEEQARKQELDARSKTAEEARIAKEEARKQQLEARQKAIEEKNKQQEQARLAREEAQHKAEIERLAKIDAQRIAKEKSDEIKKVNAEIRAQELEKARLVKEKAKRKAVEERQQILAQKEKERAAKEEARHKVVEQAKRAKEEARRQAEELKVAKLQADKEARAKAEQAKLEAKEKVKQKAQEIEIEVLQREIDGE